MAKTGDELKAAAPVTELAGMQREMGLPDGDFVRAVKLGYSGSSWGKIKAGTFSGNHTNALRAVTAALARAQAGIEVEVVDGVVLLDHVRDAVAAVEIARTTRDEHRLVVMVGEAGAGKSVTGRLLAEQFGGTYVEAHPSWARSYNQGLGELARGVGLSAVFNGAGAAERGVLEALARAPRLMVIDEANHFSRDLINFLKAVLNETRCAIVLLTLPRHLARMAAEHSEESRQLLRRAVAIIHIPAVSSAEVVALHAGLFPHVHLNAHGPALAVAANRLHRLDTVVRIFGEATATGEEIGEAAARVEKSLRTAVQP